MITRHCVRCAKAFEVRYESDTKKNCSRSCGAKVSKNRRHGHGYETREYTSWRTMRRRCLHPNRVDYHLYGGRGIKVCQRWDLFENFLADMGPRPAGHSLDRVNSNGDYEPGNCRWATIAEQNRNRRPRSEWTFKDGRNMQTQGSEQS